MFDTFITSNLNDYKIHKNPIELLKIYNKDNLPNILLHGPKNSGKKTLIKNYLKYIFDFEKIKYKIKKYSIKINNNEVKIIIKQSIYFLEINLFEYGLYDKHVLTSFIKDLATNKSVTNNYRIIIVNNIGRSTKLAQLSLRRMMEKLYNSSRFIFTATNISKVDDAVISRCYSIRVPLPNKDELLDHLKFISNKNNLNLSNSIMNEVIVRSKRDLYNLNMIILDYQIDNKFIDNPLIIFCNKIQNCLEKDGLEFIDSIRIIIYQIHLLNYSDADIFKEYVHFLSNKKIFTDSEMIMICEEAALNEHRSCIGKKPFYNLEKFFIYIKRILIERYNK